MALAQSSLLAMKDENVNSPSSALQTPTTQQLLEDIQLVPFEEEIQEEPLDETSKLLSEVQFVPFEEETLQRIFNRREITLGDRLADFLSKKQNQAWIQLSDKAASQPRPHPPSLLTYLNTVKDVRKVLVILAFRTEFFPYWEGCNQDFYYGRIPSQDDFHLARHSRPYHDYDHYLAEEFTKRFGEQEKESLSLIQRLCDNYNPQEIREFRELSARFLGPTPFRERASIQGRLSLAQLRTVSAFYKRGVFAPLLSEDPVEGIYQFKRILWPVFHFSRSQLTALTPFMSTLFIKPKADDSPCGLRLGEISPETHNTRVLEVLAPLTPSRITHVGTEMQRFDFGSWEFKDQLIPIVSVLSGDHLAVIDSARHYLLSRHYLPRHETQRVDLIKRLARYPVPLLKAIVGTIWTRSMFLSSDSYDWSYAEKILDALDQYPIDLIDTLVKEATILLPKNKSDRADCVKAFIPSVEKPVTSEKMRAIAQANLVEKEELTENGSYHCVIEALCSLSLDQIDTVKKHKDALLPAHMENYTRGECLKQLRTRTPQEITQLAHILKTHLPRLLGSSRPSMKLLQAIYHLSFETIQNLEAVVDCLLANKNRLVRVYATQTAMSPHYIGEVDDGIIISLLPRSTHYIHEFAKIVGDPGCTLVGWATKDRRIDRKVVVLKLSGFTLRQLSTLILNPYLFEVWYNQHLGVFFDQTSTNANQLLPLTPDQLKAVATHHAVLKGIDYDSFKDLSGSQIKAIVDNAGVLLRVECDAGGYLKAENIKSLASRTPDEIVAIANTIKAHASEIAKQTEETVAKITKILVKFSSPQIEAMLKHREVFFPKGASNYYGFEDFMDRLTSKTPKELEAFAESFALYQKGMREERDIFVRDEGDGFLNYNMRHAIGNLSKAQALSFVKHRRAYLSNQGGLLDLRSLSPQHIEIIGENNQLLLFYGCLSEERQRIIEILSTQTVKELMYFVDELKAMTAVRLLSGSEYDGSYSVVSERHLDDKMIKILVSMTPKQLRGLEILIPLLHYTRSSDVFEALQGYTYEQMMVLCDNVDFLNPPKRGKPDEFRWGSDDDKSRAHLLRALAHMIEQEMRGFIVFLKVNEDLLVGRGPKREKWGYDKYKRKTNPTRAQRAEMIGALSAKPANTLESFTDTFRCHADFFYTPHMNGADKTVVMKAIAPKTGDHLDTFAQTLKRHRSVFFPPEMTGYEGERVRASVIASLAALPQDRLEAVAQEIRGRELSIYGIERLVEQYQGANMCQTPST